jgi:hypothetical protein
LISLPGALVVVGLLILFPVVLGWMRSGRKHGG